MELLILVIGLIVIGILAVRFGYDSRSVPYSKEQELATYGVVWDMRHAHMEDLRREAAAWRLAQQVARRSAHGRRVRRRLAATLRALALWLSPELQRVAAHEAGGRLR
jgi:hypothetical protein